MSVWLIRAGKNGEDENYALEKGRAIVGWQEMPNLSTIRSYEDMKAKHAEVYPEMSPKAIMNNAAQLWAFLGKIKPGDIAVLPLKTRSKIAIGTVEGQYEYFEGRHTRPVKWIREDVSRDTFGQDLLYSLGAFMTVCEIKRNDAEMRIKAVMKGNPDPHLKGSFAGVKPNQPPSDEPGTEPLEGLVDLEEQATDQIRKLIESRFKGHSMARLVEAILNAQGFRTYRSPEGPDGGLDILAGRGPTGFDEPSLCVQVKSGGIQNDATIRELEGVMSRVNASKGLFVSWEGFNKSALQKEKELFFKLRLWDDKKLIAALLENYENLPEQIQAELPLKRVWVMVPEEE